MRKKLLIWIAPLILCGCSLGQPSYQDLESWHVGLVRKNDSVEFKQEDWLAGGPIERGKMVASLLRSFKFKEMQNEEVFNLLGESQCYLYYDDEPCYLIQYGTDSYRLGFGINHSDYPGKVIWVGLTKQ